MGLEQDVVRLQEYAKKRLEGKEQAQELLKKDASELITELSIHQEELNIQNEELKRAQLELEASRTKYFQLYDLAPVGYITLSPELVITEINLAASDLLGAEKKNIVNRGLSAFVTPQCQELLYLHYRRVATEGEQNHTITVLRKDGSEVLVQFESRLGGGARKRIPINFDRCHRGQES
jgi:PAS domain S-box-containing protein